MSFIRDTLLDTSDRLQMASLNHRLRRNEVIASNITNSETPGFRALGYDFEKQLQDIAELNPGTNLLTSDQRHFKNPYTTANGQITPEVYVQPSESIANDGNTVDVDKEMALFAQNQILYRATIEIINRKIALLRYAITGGR